MNNRSDIRMLMIIHKALLASQVLFAAISLFLVYSKINNLVQDYLDKILQVTAILLSTAGFFAGNFLFKKQLLEIRDLQVDAKEKLARYRGACILQWAMIEGPCLFTIIGFFITGNYAFIALAAVLMLLFAMQAPSKIKISFQLRVNEEDLDGL